jgi:hypothetical protein
MDKWSGNMFRSLVILFCIAFIALASCNRPGNRKAKNEAKEGISAAAEEVKVLAIAGSNDLIMWDTLSGGIYIARNELDFIPLPGNMAILEAPDLKTGRLRTYLPVMILSKPLEVNEKVNVKIIGCFVVERNRKLEQTLIAVPEDERLRSIHVEHFVDFITDYEPVRNILQHWLLYYRPSQNVRMVGWKDEQYAGYLISSLRYGNQQRDQ